MKTPIHIRAEFSIKARNARQFKRLISQMSRLVKAGEPETLEYKFYLSEDCMRCAVHETYADSKAALYHNNGAASRTILPEIFKISRLERLEFYGKPDRKLRKVLNELGSQNYTLVAGFSR